MNLNSCKHSAEHRTHLLRIQILPGGGKPRSLVQQRLLGDGFRPNTLNCVQHGHGISEPSAYSVGYESLNISGRDALTSLGRLIVSSGQQRFRDVIAIPDALLCRMTRRHRVALRIVNETSEEA